MSTVPALLHPKQLFGFDPNVVDNLSFVNEQSLVYVAGTVGIIYNTDQHTQRLISAIGRNKEVTVLHVSPNHQYVAVGERSLATSHIGVSVYDVATLKKCKTLVASKVQQQLNKQDKDSNQCLLKYISISFSHDTKYLIGQATQPDWTLVYWDWETGKVVATIPMATFQDVVPVHQVSFHLHDDSQVCVLGEKGCYVLRLEENNVFKMISVHHTCGVFYSCQVWISDTRVLLGAEHGKVILLEGTEIKEQFQIVKMSSDETHGLKFDIVADDEESDESHLEEHPVTKLVTFSKGFVCCCGMDTVYMFERFAGGSVYRQAAAIRVPNNDNEYVAEHIEAQNGQSRSKVIEITALTISPSEDILAVATNNRRIYTFTLTSVDINKSASFSFEPLTSSVHCGGLRDIDVCLRMPIAVTCATDKTIAVWNYNTNQQQLFKELEEEVLSVALHPTGLYLLVGCTTKLRLMGLMINDVRVVHEFPIKDCPSCSFSHGGHMIAAVQGSGIVVFSTVTFDTVSSFKGHVGKILSISWTLDDLKLVSCGMDGAIYEWDVHSTKRTNEVVIKGCTCNCLTVGTDNFTSFVVGSDAVVREVAESQVLGELVLPNSPPLTSVALLHSGKAMFVSSKQGNVWVVSVPLSNHEDFQEFQSISNDIVKMRLTHDDKWLLTVSTDGILGIWKVSDKDGRFFQSDEDMPFLEEILITRADLEEKNLTISELSQQVRDLRSQMEFQKRNNETEHNEEVKRISDDFENRITDLRTEIEKLDVKKTKDAEHYEETLKSTNEKHRLIKMKLQTETHQKLVLEYQKYQELQTLGHKECEQMQKQVDTALIEKEVALNRMSQQHEVEMNKMMKRLEKVELAAIKSKEESEEMMKLIEEDADREINELNTSHETEMVKLKDVNKKMMDEMGILKQKVIGLRKNVEDQGEVILKGQMEHRHLDQVIKGLEEDIQLLRQEIQDRDNLLLAKENNILELRCRNEELNKMKFLHELKIEGMESELEPTVKRFQLTEQKLNQVSSKLDRLNEELQEKEITNLNLKQKLKILNSSLKSKELKIQDLKTSLKNIKYDLNNCSQLIHDHKKLKQQLMTVCIKYQSTKGGADQAPN